MNILSQEHKCKNKIIEKAKSEESDSKIKYQKNKELASNLILLNIQKPLSFHISNLKKNNIMLSINQIKYLIQKVREQNYPSNKKYLKDISF